MDDKKTLSSFPSRKFEIVEPFSSTERGKRLSKKNITLFLQHSTFSVNVTSCYYDEITSPHGHLGTGEEESSAAPLHMTGLGRQKSVHYI